MRAEELISSLSIEWSLSLLLLHDDKMPISLCCDSCADVVGSFLKHLSPTVSALLVLRDECCCSPKIFPSIPLIKLFSISLSLSLHICISLSLCLSLHSSAVTAHAVMTSCSSRAGAFDWGSDRLVVRSAECADAMTGCTLLLFGDKAEAVRGGVGSGDDTARAEGRFATSACDVRGGSPGTLMSTDGRIDAILFVGGSTLGFAALDGIYASLIDAVRARQEQQQQQYNVEAASTPPSSDVAVAERQRHLVGWETIPIIRGGVIFDWAWRTRALLTRIGDRPPNETESKLLSRYPDYDLGKALFAREAAKDDSSDGESARVGIGCVGAGCGASCGKLYGIEYAEAGGQGFASWSGGANSRARIVVLTIVNSVGAIVDCAGNVVLGNRSPVDGRRRHPFQAGAVSLCKEDAHVNMHFTGDDSSRDAAGGNRGGGRGGESTAGAGENTTLTCLVTNISLSGAELRQLARTVHSSMARCIQPFHCQNDGDILYAVSTHEIQRGANDDVQILGALASDVARDAVLSIATERNTVNG